MKKIIIMTIMMLFLTGCSSDKAEAKTKQFITKITDCSTYGTEDKNKDNLPDVFEQYFSEEGYETLINSQMGFIYREFFRIADAKKIKQMNIKKMDKIKEKKGTRYKYSAQYTVVCKNKKIKMKDELMITLDKDNKISEIIILNTSDVIQKTFLNVKIM